jgi:hypothetical protein
MALWCCELLQLGKTEWNHPEAKTGCYVRAESATCSLNTGNASDDVLLAATCAITPVPLQRGRNASNLDPFETRSPNPFRQLKVAVHLLGSKKHRESRSCALRRQRDEQDMHTRS